MFADPQTVTFDAPIGAKSFAKVNQDQYSSEYRCDEATGRYTLKLRNSQNSNLRDGVMRVERHNVELVHELFPVPGTAPYGFRRKVYIVIENEVGDDKTVVNDVAEGLLLWATEANIVKLLAFES